MPSSTTRAQGAGEISYTSVFVQCMARLIVQCGRGWRRGGHAEDAGPGGCVVCVRVDRGFDKPFRATLGGCRDVVIGQIIEIIDRVKRPCLDNLTRALYPFRNKRLLLTSHLDILQSTRGARRDHLSLLSVCGIIPPHSHSFTRTIYSTCQELVQ